ncbi:MAG: thioesterase family protein [Anaerolineae bacterium]
MTEQPYISEIQVRVRYAETDAMGIVHHAQYIVYFEEGRSSYARERGSAYSDIERSGYYLTVTGVNVRYMHPARYDELLLLRTWVTEMKSRGITFAYEILNAESGERLVTGSTNHICITHEGKVAKIPEAWRGWG